MEGEALSFGQWLQRRRRALHLTQQQLGYLAGCSAGMIRKMEAEERRPSTDVARLLATALQLPPNEYTTFLRFARGERVDTPAQAEAWVAPVVRPIQPSTNVPAPTTALIGRDQDVAAVRALLERNNVRLVTLTGPGGVGKTRLSFAVGAALVNAFIDGVIFVDLAPISDPALVLPTIAQALDMKEQGSQPLLSSVQAHLRDKRLLLLLDNCEQVLASGSIVAGLLRAAANLKVLATSRSPLRVQGEYEYAVSPLRTPPASEWASLERLLHYDAVRLFIDRARAVKHDFEVTNTNASAVAEICTRLDGLPLAIGLAAARVKLLPPHTVVRHLDSHLKVLTGGARDVPVRQQTLRSTIDWSYNLLDPDEQLLFARFGMFSGGATIEAVAAVCQEQREPTMALLDVLQSLMDKSLLQHEDANGELRFDMLETIRDYALEHFRQHADAQEEYRRYAIYYVTLAHAAEPASTAPMDTTQIKRLERESGNLSNVLRWTLRLDATEEEFKLGTRLLGSLHAYWSMSGRVTEGRRWLDTVIEHERTIEAQPRAKIYTAAGRLALMQGDYGPAILFAHEALTSFYDTNDRQGIGYQLQTLGLAAFEQGDFERAYEYYSQSLTVYDQLGDAFGIAWAMNGLGLAAVNMGEYREAGARYDQCLALFHRLRSQRGVAWSLLNVAYLAYCQQDYDQAEVLYAQSLCLWQELDRKRNIGLALSGLGYVAFARAKYDQAAEKFKESLTLFQTLGAKRDILDCFIGLAAVASELGSVERAAQLLAIVEAVQRQLASSLRPVTRETYERSLAVVRAQLHPAMLARIWIKGEAMSLEQAVAYALEEESTN